MKAKDFDKKFDDGNEDIVEHLNISTVKRVNTNSKRVNVDFPAWMVKSLDNESHRLGVTRQSLIKMWIADKLENQSHSRI